MFGIFKRKKIAMSPVDYNEAPRYKIIPSGLGFSIERHRVGTILTYCDMYRDGKGGRDELFKHGWYVPGFHPHLMAHAVIFSTKEDAKKTIDDEIAASNKIKELNNKINQHAQDNPPEWYP